MATILKQDGRRNWPLSSLEIFIWRAVNSQIGSLMWLVDIDGSDAVWKYYVALPDLAKNHHFPVWLSSCFEAKSSTIKAAYIESVVTWATRLVARSNTARSTATVAILYVGVPTAGKDSVYCCSILTKILSGWTHPRQTSNQIQEWEN